MTVALAWAALAGLMLARPGLGLLERRRGQRPSLRVRSLYLGVAGLLLVFVASGFGLSSADLGLTTASPMRLLLATVAGVALVVGADVITARLLARDESLLRVRALALKAWLGEASSSRWWLATYILAAALFEELLFRGLGFYLAAEAQVPILWAGLGLAVLFGVQHTAGGRTGVAYAVVFGLYFGGLYLAAGSLIAPILAHAAGNAWTLFWTYPRLSRQLAARPAPAFLF